MDYTPNPNYAEGYYRLSTAYKQQGRLDEAIQAAETAFNLGFREAQALLTELKEAQASR